jgi:hypothetical protein
MRIETLDLQLTDQKHQISKEREISIMSPIIHTRIDFLPVQIICSYLIMSRSSGAGYTSDFMCDFMSDLL